jgi:hypothetical protein
MLAKYWRIIMNQSFRLVLVAFLGVALSTACPAAPDAAEGVARKASPKGPPAPDQLFQAVDADGNGKVSLTELHARHPEFPKARFQRLDKNGDGFLIKSELPQRKRPSKASAGRGEDTSELIRYVKGLVRKHDANGDNALSLAELQAGKPGFPKTTFTALDRDKNGVLNSKDGGQPEIKKGGTDKPEQRSTPQGTPARQKIDKNKDGKTSFEEAKAAYPNLNRERFDRRDRNGDGFWSPLDRKGR